MQTVFPPPTGPVGRRTFSEIKSRVCRPNKNHAFHSGKQHWYQHLQQLSCHFQYADNKIYKYVLFPTYRSCWKTFEISQYLINYSYKWKIWVHIASGGWFLNALWKGAEWIKLSNVFPKLTFGETSNLFITMRSQWFFGKMNLTNVFNVTVYQF